MYQIRNKTAPLAFSGSFEKISHGYPTNFSQFDCKISKTALSESKFRISFRRPSTGIIFFKILKKKLSHFRFLNLNSNLDCFLLAMKLHTFNTFQLWLRKNLLTKGAWWQRHSGFLRVLPCFKSQYESYYLKLEKCLCSIFVCFYNIWRLCEEKYMIWYQYILPNGSLWKSNSQVRSYELRVEIHELRVEIHELRVQIDELRVQIHELQVQIHEVRVQIHELGD